MKLQDVVNRIGIKPNENNKSLNTYIQNNIQNKERLDNFLSALNNIPESLQTAGITDIKELYNYIYKGLDGLEYTVSDINKVANSPIYFGTGYDTGNKRIFGLALSALINKVAKKGDKVQLNISKPMDHLFYLADGIEAHVNIAGDYLGDSAKNSKIYAEKAEYAAGVSMNKCELHVNEAGNYLGEFADNSKIYAEKAEYAAGHYMDNCELHVRLAGENLGDSAKNSKIYADKAGLQAGARVDNCELHINEAGEQLGFYAKNSKIYVEKSVGWAGHNIDNCELHINEAGDDLGANANNSIIYANETGYNTGVDMKNSKLHIKKLNGDLANSCFKGNNEIYLGKESYKLHPIKYKLKRVNIWETP